MEVRDEETEDNDDPKTASTHGSWKPALPPVVDQGPQECDALDLAQVPTVLEGVEDVFEDDPDPAVLEVPQPEGGTPSAVPSDPPAKAVDKQAPAVAAVRGQEWSSLF